MVDCKSKNFQVDLENLHTNILLIHIKTKKVKAGDLSKRLLEVTDDEIKNGIVDENGKCISLGISARDWEFVRLVFYGTLKPTDTSMAIKKLRFVIQEYDRTLV